MAVRVEFIEPGEPVPEGALCIPYPRKPDGTLVIRSTAQELIAKAIADAPSKGYDRIVVEYRPDD